MDTTDARFDEIYSSFRSRLVRYLSRLVGDASAEDVVQEVFLRVSRALPAFRGEAKLSTWLYAIATNAALDHLRKAEQRAARRAGRVGEGGDAPAASAVRNETPAVSVEEAAIRSEMSACIREMLLALPAAYRAVIVLSEYEGLTDKELAEALGVSIAAAKIRLHRARAALRGHLGGNCQIYRNERNDLHCDRLPPAPLQRRPAD